MKIRLATLAALLLAATIAPANSNRSASFYLNTPEKYEGQKLTLYVAEVDRRGAVEGLNGVLFSAYTMTRDGDESSFIEVLVPREKADSFARRYGSDFKFVNGKPRLLSMRGILRQIRDNWYLEIEP